MQRMLNFLDTPIPEMQAWETLEEKQRMLAIAVLARLMAQATFKDRGLEEKDHDR